MKPTFLWSIMCVVGLTTPVLSVPWRFTFARRAPAHLNDKNGIQIKMNSMVIVEDGENPGYNGRAGTVSAFVGDAIKVHFRAMGKDVMQIPRHLTVVKMRTGREPRVHERALYSRSEPADLADKIGTITQPKPGQLKWGGRDIDESWLKHHLVLLVDPNTEKSEAAN